MLGGLVVCGVPELAVLCDLQPGWGGWGWGGQAVPRWASVTRGFVGPKGGSCLSCKTPKRRARTY